MQSSRIAKVAATCLIILLIVFLLLYYLKTSFPAKLNKSKAIELCQEVVYAKVDKNLPALFKEASYKKTNKEITISLDFISNKDHKKHKSAATTTTAQCVFVPQYNSNGEVRLKSFFYQDINKNIHMYYNTLIKISLVK